jgi:hypothetical protein
VQLYQQLRESGLQYGPAFRCARPAATTLLLRLVSVHGLALASACRASRRITVPLRLPRPAAGCCEMCTCQMWPVLDQLAAAASSAMDTARAAKALLPGRRTAAAGTVRSGSTRWMTPPSCCHPMTRVGSTAAAAALIRHALRAEDGGLRCTCAAGLHSASAVNTTKHMQKVCCNSLTVVGSLKRSRM